VRQIYPGAPHRVLEKKARALDHSLSHRLLREGKSRSTEGRKWIFRYPDVGAGEKTLLRVISLISSLMAQLLVRDLEDAVVHALRQKAAEEGTSVEEAHRRILRLALLSKKPKKGFKEFLLGMPEGGDDSIFDRHRSQPRQVLL
jgi:antitoxin FitA